MKPRFSMITFLALFSLAVTLISFSLNALILRFFGTSIQVTSSLLGNVLLLTGILGVLVTGILAEQKRELDKLKAEVALLSRSGESKKTAN
ncbi:MAG: hypothetical protein P4L92_02385 [Rudaea sp.]|nr:hypothetical protein [Rudaea sp.]